ERVMRDARVNLIIEGTSEIMHLFIAREALDTHLRRMKPLLSPKVSLINKLKAIFSSGFHYFFWYLRLLIPFNFLAGGNFPAPLKKHIKYINRNSKRLARTIFHKMVYYQQKLESKQNIMARIVNIGTDLFAMSAALSYAAGLIKKGSDKSEIIALADLFCSETKARIENQFCELCCNNDKKIKSVNKKILADKYLWLEDGIIKPS
ncbi:MAG: hypothetical protein AB1633_08635, partial [Elusimicrobiota bacterium]